MRFHPITIFVASLVLSSGTAHAAKAAASAKPKPTASVKTTTRQAGKAPAKKTAPARKGSPPKKKKARPSRLFTPARAKPATKRPVRRRRVRIDTRRYRVPQISARKLKCPVGKGSFTVRAIRNLLISRRDSDLRPRLPLKLTQADYVWVCPRNCYATLPWHFGKQKLNPAALEKAVTPFFKPYASYKKIPPVVRYRCALATYRLLKKGPRFFANLLLRASWAAREAKRPKWERKFRARAILAFTIGLKRRLYPKKKRPTVLYLLGELNRRQKNFKIGAYWLKKAKAALKGRKRSKGLLRMIRRAYVRSVKRIAR